MYLHFGFTVGRWMIRPLFCESFVSAYTPATLLGSLPRLRNNVYLAPLARPVSSLPHLKFLPANGSVFLPSLPYYVLFVLDALF